MDDWTNAGIVTALGSDVAPTAGYRGALARPVNRVVDKVVAKPQAARPCNEDLIPPTRPTFRLRRAQCSKEKCLKCTLARGLWDTYIDRERCGKRSWLHWTRDAESPTGLYVGCWVCARFCGRNNLSACKCSWIQKVNCGKAQQVCKSSCCNQPVLGKAGVVCC